MMKQEIKNRLRKNLPTFVFDSLYEDYTSDAIGKIIDNYLLDSDEKLSQLKNVIGLTALKDVKIENLFSTVKEELGLDGDIATTITLIVLTEIFYPISSFFPGIEDEILKLGGKIPKTKPVTIDQQMIKREEEMEAMSEMEEKKEEEAKKDMIVNLPIGGLSKKYPQVESQQIGAQESIIVQGSDVPMKPEIKYWIKDYMEKTGYHAHSNLDRVQYVYHDKNTRNMNEEERRQLGLVLKSLDEETPLPYSTKKQRIDFGMIE